MAFLIESLIGNPVKRKDDKRLTITRRPPPARPREFWELIAVMGRNASAEGLVRGIDLRTADPRMLIYAMLARWPSAAEIRELEVPYNAVAHIRTVLRSAEFRAGVPRRLCETFPERQRLMFVPLPRSATAHVMSVLDDKHPILPLTFADRKYQNLVVSIPYLGEMLARFGTTRTLVMVQPHVKWFLEPLQAAAPAEDPLHWHDVTVPCRSVDVLFCVIRPPLDLLVSEANGLLGQLRAPAQDGEPALVAQTRARLGKLPAPDRTAEWKAIGRLLLAQTQLRNPVCTALGDGTDAGAMDTCIRSHIHLVSIEGYPVWSLSAFDCAPSEKMNVSEKILSLADLPPDERARAESFVAEDLKFYTRFAAKREVLGTPAVKGFELWEPEGQETAQAKT